jgi:hypothetical protein
MKSKITTFIFPLAVSSKRIPATWSSSDPLLEAAWMFPGTKRKIDKIRDAVIVNEVNAGYRKHSPLFVLRFCVL